MEKCIFNYKIFNIYIRLTEGYRFCIIRQIEGQWRAIIDIKLIK